VTLTYQDVGGVLVVSRLTQNELLYKGAIKTLDVTNRTLTVGNKTFQVDDRCVVLLRNDRHGTLADIKPGHFVTVLYEDPEGMVVARRIAETSKNFARSLTAIDLSERTIKAKAALGSKTFHLANHCSIRVNGKPAEMKNLRPGDEIEFNYDEVDGINVATRIATGREELNDAPQSRAR
jgi:hypothetical protein